MKLILAVFAGITFNIHKQCRYWAGTMDYLVHIMDHSGPLGSRF